MGTGLLYDGSDTLEHVCFFSPQDKIFDIATLCDTSTFVRVFSDLSIVVTVSSQKFHCGLPTIWTVEKAEQRSRVRRWKMQRREVESEERRYNCAAEQTDR